MLTRCRRQEADRPYPLQLVRGCRSRGIHMKTLDKETVKACAPPFADTTTDVILRLRLKHGRAVEDYSCFPDTQEVVASARARFVVASGPRIDGGFTYVDLVEESREHF